jgi:hypothetical protein
MFFRMVYCCRPHESLPVCPCDPNKALVEELFSHGHIVSPNYEPYVDPGNLWRQVLFVTENLLECLISSLGMCLDSEFHHSLTAKDLKPENILLAGNAWVTNVCTLGISGDPVSGDIWGCARPNNADCVCHKIRICLGTYLPASDPRWFHDSPPIEALGDIHWVLEIFDHVA